MEETVFLYNAFSELKFKNPELSDNLMNCQPNKRSVRGTGEQVFGF